MEGLSSDRDLSQSETIAILVHEHAHEMLHQKSGRKHECSRTVRETEAEAVAFVVCQALGLDSVTRSADYIQLYRGDTETLAESLELIQKTAASIVDAIRDVTLPEAAPCQPMEAGPAGGGEHTSCDVGSRANLLGTEVAAEADNTVRVASASCGRSQRYQPKEDASCIQ